MEAGYDQFPNIAQEGWDVGSRGDEEDGVGKSFDASFTLLFFHLISHSRIPPLFFCLNLHPKGYKLTVPAGSLLQQYFHQVFDELLPTAILTKNKKKPRSKFGRRVRGGKQKASTTFLARSTASNSLLPAIPPGAARADDPVSDPRTGKTRQQLIGQLGNETRLRLNAEAREEKEREEKQKLVTTKSKHIQKNLDICAALREAKKKLRKTERQLSNTTTKLQLKEKELVVNNNMWNDEMASVVAASEVAVDIRLAERDGENTRAAEKKVKVSFIYAISSDANYIVLSHCCSFSFT
jgi:hypothetical protein